MKKLLLTWLAFSAFVSVKAQQNIYDLNDFKMIYLMPNGIDEKYDINKIIKNKLNKSGIEVATSRVPIMANASLETCAVLTCEVGHGNSNTSGFERDEIFIHFFDCQGKAIYSCSALSSVKLLSKSAYQNACEEALSKFDFYKHDYSPSTRKTTSLSATSNAFGISGKEETTMLTASTDNNLVVQAKLDAIDDDRPLPLKVNASILAQNSAKTTQEDPKKHIPIEEYSMSAKANRVKSSLPAIFQENYRSPDEILTTKAVLKAEKTAPVAVPTPPVAGTPTQVIVAPPVVVSITVPVEKVAMRAIAQENVIEETESKKSNLPSIFQESYTRPEDMIASSKALSRSSASALSTASARANKVAETVVAIIPVETKPAPIIVPVPVKAEPVVLPTPTEVAVPVVATPIVATSVVAGPPPADRNRDMATVSSSVSNSKYGMRVAPVFPGGTKQLFSYVKAKMKYPAGAVADGIQGKVHIGFVIDPMGNITTITVEKSLRDDLDMEAVRIVSQMPPWRPAMIQGEPTKAKVIIPIDFILTR